MNRKLHIGGTVSAEGWEVFNIQQSEMVDHVGDARDLSRFADTTFDCIYASHVLEHFGYKQEISNVLHEWFRVLKKGGTLYVSVPDLDILAQLLLMKDKLSLEERFQIMRMLFGGHTNEYDYHATGLNLDFLSLFLQECGFTKIRRVATFGLFQDTSTLLFRGIPISLNLKAERPL